MKRRVFLKLSAATVVAGSPLMAHSEVVPALPSDVSGMVVFLESLGGKQIETQGAWNAAQVYCHLAQSIEFSMTGYPEQKSALFKNTVGSLAFAFFASRGRMSHALDEAIPGAAALDANGSADQMLQRLMGALKLFDEFDGELQPHFAYGGLTKQEYALAHIMHINNHMDEFVL